MTDIDFNGLQKRTLLRQRRKTNLVEHQISIKKLMDLNVSLPVMLEWLLEEKKVDTTLPALRRFVRREFGDEFYNNFVARNGWQKAKHEKSLSSARAPDKPAKQKPESLMPKRGVTQEELKAIARQKIDLREYDEE